MRAKLSALLRSLIRTDLDALVPPILLAIGAEQLWTGSGLLALGAALYLPVLIESVRRPARRA